MIESTEDKTSTQNDDKDKLNKEIIQAARNCNLPKLKALVQAGADINYTATSGSDGWYGGDTNTPLSLAVRYDFHQGEQEKYISTIQFLLQNGASPSQTIRRGNWSRQRSYSIFQDLNYILHKFPQEDYILKYLSMLVKYGVDVNVIEWISSRKSQNSWHSCLLFQLMDRAELTSKFRELQKLYQDLEEIRREKQEKFAKMYNQQNKLAEFDQNYVRLDHHNENREQSEKQAAKKISIDLIKKIINLGINLDRSAGSSSSYNQKLDQYQEYGGQFYEQILPYYECKIQELETVLHRAIMNNNVELVKLLIEKGVGLSKCVFTVSKGLYPQQWPEQLRNYMVRENKDKLRKLEKRKAFLQQCLSKQTQGKQRVHQPGYGSSQQEQQDLMEIKKKLAHNKFEIFKAQRFTIQGSLPLKKYERIAITCLELAEKFKVDPETVELLKKCQTEAK